MINELYSIQKELNDRIVLEHNLNKDDLLNDKFLALLVELSEFANETRAFKYWSLKPASAKEIMIEEFSDVLHFLLTIGLELGSPKLSFYDQESDLSITELFLGAFSDINLIRAQMSSFVYIRLYNRLMLIGKEFGFSEQDIYDSYMRKNKINHKRQDSGY